MKKKNPINQNKIFQIKNESEFENIALEIFKFQAQYNPVYSRYLELLNIQPETVTHLQQIPFLPISFFKTHKILCEGVNYKKVFESSGTTGQTTSKHYIADLFFYEDCLLRSFELFFGSPKNYCFLALLPSYLERENSSLVYMVNKLIERSNRTGGFFLKNYKELSNQLQQQESKAQATILIGVSFALLEFAEEFPIPLKTTKILETGGMKGRRKEIVRSDLHNILKRNFHVDKICSEYGMTELLSQAYSLGDGYFKCPPWMKIVIRDYRDPFKAAEHSETGGINIIDLANFHSCCFIETQDIGRTLQNGSFEILGRMENSEIRGCNLMIN